MRSQGQLSAAQAALVASRLESEAAAERAADAQRRLDDAVPALAAREAQLKDERIAAGEALAAREAELTQVCRYSRLAVSVLVHMKHERCPFGSSSR